ncbi:hypothetical protein L518_0907 [Bordetella bronchiseptica MBORD675]|nr:hypothetical protein L518_0907 [Bordetella bronchiseptica MBORD675]
MAFDLVFGQVERYYSKGGFPFLAYEDMEIVHMISNDQ